MTTVDLTTKDYDGSWNIADHQETNRPFVIKRWIDTSVINLTNAYIYNIFTIPIGVVITGVVVTVTDAETGGSTPSIAVGDTDTNNLFEASADTAAPGSTVSADAAKYYSAANELVIVADEAHNNSVFCVTVYGYSISTPAALV